MPQCTQFLQSIDKFNNYWTLCPVTGVKWGEIPHSVAEGGEEGLHNLLWGQVCFQPCNHFPTFILFFFFNIFIGV